MKSKSRCSAVLAGLKGSVIGRVKPDINKGVPHYTSGWRLTYNGMQRRGFTLIELLVVVLIIGILAAVALSQYQKVVEKSRLTEAITILRSIANANQIFFMHNGRYAGPTEIDLLDITVPGAVDTTWGSGRIRTKYFIYSPTGSGILEDLLALAQRTSDTENPSVYKLYIKPEAPNRIYCTANSNSAATSVQRKLCNEVNARGSL